MNCPACDSNLHAKVASKNSYDIHCCDECSLLFIHPFPTPEELTEFYENYHKTQQYKDKIKSKVKRARKRVGSIRKKGKTSFLDVGCNLGFATEAARTLGYKALGIDIDSDAINRAAQLFPEAEFRYIPISELAAEGNRFDFIYCSEVIEHLIDPLQFLKDVRAVMSDDAILFLTTPDVGHYSLPKEMEKLVEWTTFRPPEHLLYFNKSSLARIMERAGFENTKFRFNFKPTLKVVSKTLGPPPA